MKMIIGGAHQGQLAWARKHFPEISDEEWIDGAACEPEEINTCRGIYDFQEYVRRIMQLENEGMYSHAVEDLADEMIYHNPDLIIVSDEIGYGLVPIDAFERRYREQVGRICTKLASHCEQVVRVVMGIGTVIKGKD